MKEWVEQILQNSKKRSFKPNARQLFYREFDQALRQVSYPQCQLRAGDRWMQLEDLGLKAGIPLDEISSRKKTLLYALSHMTVPSLIM